MINRSCVDILRPYAMSFTWAPHIVIRAHRMLNSTQSTNFICLHMLDKLEGEDWRLRPCPAYCMGISRWNLKLTLSITAFCCIDWVWHKLFTEDRLGKVRIKLLLFSLMQLIILNAYQWLIDWVEFIVPFYIFLYCSNKAGKGHSEPTFICLSCTETATASA